MQGDTLRADKHLNRHSMRNLDNDNKRAVELLGLLLDDATGPATKEEIRAWLWSNVSNDAKDAAMAEVFREMESNTAPDETDRRKFAELAVRLNLEGYVPVPAPASAPKKRNMLRTPMRVAASVVVVLGLVGVTYLWLNRAVDTAEDHPVAEVKISAGASAQSVLLPDGSSVQLAANSELTYDEDFTSGRRVYLDGEALLTVGKSIDEAGKPVPFSVTTDDLKVDVYGTVFKVVDHSDDGDDRSIVVLYDGSVTVTADDSSVTLNNGETYYYDHTTRKPDIGLILAKDMVEHGFMPLLRFDESSLGNLVASIAANYKVEFVLPKDIDLSKGKFSGDFQAEDLKSTLNILTKSSARLSFIQRDDKVFVQRKEMR